MVTLAEALDSMSSLAIVIPTYGRSPLLERTLLSLADCQFPEQLKRIIVVENGGKEGAEKIIHKLRNHLPLKYCFSEPKNKSIALNSVLSQSPADFLIFLDDDVRADPGLLVAYAREIGNQKGGFFLGGRVEVDYEEPPPDWLLPYLPVSAKGWSLGQVKSPIDRETALGANWGAFTADLNSVGGFDPRFGPGTSARGQETVTQRRLLARNIKGFFIPDAVLWHYVPKDRCSPEWALSRVYQFGVRKGIELAQASFLLRCRKVPVLWLKRQCQSKDDPWESGKSSSKKMFVQCYTRAYLQGIWVGFREKSHKGPKTELLVNRRSACRPSNDTE